MTGGIEVELDFAAVEVLIWHFSSSSILGNGAFTGQGYTFPNCLVYEHEISSRDHDVGSTWVMHMYKGPPERSCTTIMSTAAWHWPQQLPCIRNMYCTIFCAGTFVMFHISEFSLFHCLREFSHFAKHHKLDPKIVGFPAVDLNKSLRQKFYFWRGHDTAFVILPTILHPFLCKSHTLRLIWGNLKA